jgi:hypothetical protein
VVAMKKADRGEGLVVRLWEQAGQETPVTLKLSGAAGFVKTVLGAYALKTLRLRQKAGRLTAREITLLEQPDVKHSPAADGI